MSTTGVRVLLRRIGLFETAHNQATLGDVPCLDLENPPSGHDPRSVTPSFVDEDGLESTRRDESCPFLVQSLSKLVLEVSWKT